MPSSPQVCRPRAIGWLAIRHPVPDHIARTDCGTEAGAANVAPRVFVERSPFGRRLCEPLNEITTFSRCDVDVTAFLVRIAGAAHPVGELRHARWLPTAIAGMHWTVPPSVPLRVSPGQA